MKRPSLQFYVKDWRTNPKLRRCSVEARGSWIDVLCFMHDSEEYGVLRWPLEEIAHAAGLPMKPLRELVVKGVMKGGDDGCDPYVYTPRHAGKDGDPVTLVIPGDGPCWYSSRMVRDEYVRAHAGAKTRFQKADDPSPTRRHGVDQGTQQGDGSAAASASAVPPKQQQQVTLAGASEQAPTAPRSATQPQVNPEMDKAAREFAETCDGNHVTGVNAETIRQWLSDGVTPEHLRQAIAKARRGKKPEPLSINVNYLQPIIVEIRAGAPTPRTLAWRAGAEPDKVLVAAAKELGIPAWRSEHDGETHGQFRQRIIAAGGEDLITASKSSVIAAVGVAA